MIGRYSFKKTEKQRVRNRQLQVVIIHQRTYIHDDAEEPVTGLFQQIVMADLLRSL